MLHLIVATRNPHKTREFAQMLGRDVEVHDLTARADLPEVEETGSTFEENAALKAMTISRLVDGLVVADDSGLEVDALGGAPGVYSARYAGQHATDSENVAKLIRQLAEKNLRDGGAAQFRCALALARAGKLLGVFIGVAPGTVTRKPVGDGGFGYDPVFKPEGSDQTFAQMTTAQKNLISHRARALAQLRDYLKQPVG